MPGSPLSPGLPIVLHGPRSRLPVYGLVDSGADETLIPYDLMSHLGISDNDCDVQQAGTASGTGQQYIWRKGPLKIELQQLGRSINVQGSFMQGLMPGLVLLGRSDFFSHFLVEIDERSQAFSLDPYA